MISHGFNIKPKAVTMAHRVLPDLASPSACLISHHLPFTAFTFLPLNLPINSKNSADAIFCDEKIVLFFASYQGPEMLY